MNRRWFRVPAWAALFFCVFAATSCDQSRAPESPVAPSSSVASTSYTLVNDPLPLSLSPSELISTKLIGLTGGSISLLGHSITVPYGAVATPTFFTIAVLPTGYVEVQLLALAPSLFGSLVNVGENGFKKPVTLTLTYSRSTQNLDPSRLLILYVDGSEQEPVPSVVDPVAKTVSAQLQHFSKYCMASN